MARTTPAQRAANRPRHRAQRTAHPDRSDARLLDMIQRFRPASYWSLLQGIFRRLSGGEPSKIV